MSLSFYPHPFPLLLEIIIKPYRIEYLHRIIRHLIGLDPLQSEHPIPQRHQLRKLGYNIRKEPFDVVHHFIEGKISHCDVSKIPVIFSTIFLYLHQFGLDLLLPVELRGLLRHTLHLTSRSIHLAYQPYDIVFDIMLTFERVQFDCISHSVSQQGQMARLANDVFDDAVLTRHHEIAVFEEGEPFYYPIFSLISLIVFPLFRSEVLVTVG